MSKSDNDRESRTVANSPLQQSSFVFFPEEEAVRRMILQAPETFRREAYAALDVQKKRLNGRKAQLAKAGKEVAGAAEEIGNEAIRFANRLPQSLFGTVNGSEWILDIGILFDRINAKSNAMARLTVSLESWREPDGFDPDRFLFAANVLNDPAVAKETEEVRQETEAVRAAAVGFAEKILTFCETVNRFFGQVAQAADLEHDCERARFGTVRSLCGELRHTAELFAKECRATV